MIKTIIKILIALAIVNAAARSGMVAWNHFQLEDAAQQLILFGAVVPTTELANQILAKAVELDVPLDRQDIDVTRDGTLTSAYVSYTQPVEFFPNFAYPLDLSFMVEARSLNPSGVK